MKDLGSGAVAPPIDPAAEKAALAWLDGASTNWQYTNDDQHRDVLKAMLSRPVLPGEGEATPELVEALWYPMGAHGRSHREVVEDVLRTLRVELTKPKTKKAVLVRGHQNGTVVEIILELPVSQSEVEVPV